MLDLTKITVLSGLLTTFLIFFITIFRQKRLDPADLGSFIIAYISGSNIPPAVFLCLYVFYPDSPTVETKLRGYERYIFLAGLVLFLVSILTLWALLQKAYKKEEKGHT
jgi:membrane protein DedA with SNARE-associated domain